MGTTTMLFLMITGIIIICLLLVSNEHRQQNRKLKKLLKEFSEQASHRSLVFTSQEVFDNCILGLDAVERQLLILDRTIDPGHITHIQLNQVKRCVAKHHFKRCYENDVSQLNAIECCSLVFEFFDGSTLEVPFRNDRQNVGLLKEMSDNTSRWAIILSQLLPTETDNSSPRRLRRAS